MVENTNGLSLWIISFTQRVPLEVADKCTEGTLF